MASGPSSPLERPPPRVGYLHTDDLDRSLIVPYGFTRDRGELVADKARKQVAGKTAGSENRLGDPARRIGQHFKRLQLFLCQGIPRAASIGRSGRERNPLWLSRFQEPVTVSRISRVGGWGVEYSTCPTT